MESDYSGERGFNRALNSRGNVNWTIGWGEGTAGEEDKMYLFLDKSLCRDKKSSTTVASRKTVCLSVSYRF